MSFVLDTLNLKSLEEFNLIVINIIILLIVTEALIYLLMELYHPLWSQ